MKMSTKEELMIENTRLKDKLALYRKINHRQACIIKESLELNKPCQEYALYEPHPYKFEDLKPKMWVWDDKEKEFIKCKLGNNRLGNDCVVYDWDISPDEEFEEYYREYEEGRFFPATKVLEYQGDMK